MFFVRKDNINTLIGQQKEFTAAKRRGIRFFSQPIVDTDHAVWHYLFPSSGIEPSLRAQFTAAPQRQLTEDDLEEQDQIQHHGAHEPVGAEWYIWSQEVATGEVIGEPLITPFPEFDGYNWAEKASQLWAAQTSPQPA